MLDLADGDQTVGSLAGVDGSSLLLGAATLITGGDGTSSTFAGSISGTGSLVKEGGGEFTLNGDLSYSGGTRVNGGTLAIAMGSSLSNSANLSVAVDAVLDCSAGGLTLVAEQRISGSGTVRGAVVAADGSVLAPDETAPLTFQNGLSLQSGAEVVFVGQNLRVSGGIFACEGPLEISVAGAMPQGSYTLIDWNGATSDGVTADDFVIDKTSEDLAIQLTVTNNALRLTIFPADPQDISVDTIASLRQALDDLAGRYPVEYAAKSAEYLNRLDNIEADYLASESGANATYKLLKREALLLNNPAVDFDQLMFVRRSSGLGLPANWQNVSSVADTACNDSLVVLDIAENSVETLYKPAMDQFLGYPSLHWDGDRMLFTGQVLTNGVRPYTVFEMNTDGSGLQQVSPAAGSDIDWFDACYLPNGDKLMVSTATFAGVPCVNGADHVGNIYRVSADGGTTRQLTFDQDQNWGPTVLPDGRVMYTRWEYSDLPHYFTRVLFTMMPDGLEQFARYGSSSYFPNSIFDAKPVPGKPSQFVAVISGHHGVKREGELILFDENLGTTEADGAVHRYCGPNPVLPEIRDKYIDERNPWPRFVQPNPLDEKQILVSARHSSNDKFGIYLVDEFDNITPLCNDSDNALFHATPLRTEPAPPVIPDRVRVGKTNGVVNLSDVYFGPGLETVPRGKVKNLRVYSVHYGYRGMGGHIDSGVDGPWDIHRILGTVPVHEDGSASFYAPANTPISVQPLDEEGKALQSFRSWYTVMPGETVSCAGCHEQRNDGMYNRAAHAALSEPDQIDPWLGPARGFSFLREVQPVLDQYCGGCHGGPGGPTNAAPDLFTTDLAKAVNWFPQSYLNLHPYVRRPGNEGYHGMSNAGEWHADTSELVQLLKKNHYGVELDDEAWSRIVTWIDLNVPAWGIWSEHTSLNNSQERRRETMLEYANLTVDPEVYPTPAPERGTFVMPDVPEPIASIDASADTLFSVIEAKAKRDAIATTQTPAELTVELENGISLVLDLIPAGSVMMGSASGHRDEAPRTLVTNTAPFYMGKFEISNEQYALFDPEHSSGYMPLPGKDLKKPGWNCDGPAQPVIRVSWDDTMQYCEWLTKKIGRRFTLPTEAQWEYACRAGTSTEMWYGSSSTDWTATTQLISGDSFYNFGSYDNLAGVEYQNNRAGKALVGATPPWYLVNLDREDAWAAPAAGSNFASNPFGLCGMHGNAAEWTRSTYAAYPYVEGDGRNRAVYSAEEWMHLRKVVRGGSCADRESRATASFRTAMPAWQRGWNVGFRVIADVDDVLSGIPVAVLSAGPTNGVGALTVDFDGSASRDNGAVARYDWDFGDGSSATGASALSHVYTVPGSYTATLTVKDDDGFTHSASSQITVAAQTISSPAPIARIVTSTTPVAAPARISFSATSSTVHDDSALWYWDFGDGIYGSGAQTAHTYQTAGRYLVSLTVIDAAGLRDTATETVIITGAGGNESPLVDAGPNSVVTVGIPFVLSGSVSDEGSTTVVWSLIDGPGEVLFNNATFTNAEATFVTNGTYLLQLEASDGELTGTDTVSITVDSGGIYHSPQETAWSPDGAWLAVADVTARSLVLINPESVRVVHTVVLEGEPLDIVWNGARSLFVSENGAGTIAEIDPVAGAVVRRLNVGPKPSGLALVPSKNLLLVADRGLNRVALLDLDSGVPQAHVPVVREPGYVAVTPDSNFAMVANHLPLGDGRDPDLGAVLTLINLNNPTDVHALPLPAGATGVRRPVCSPDGRWAYVPHQMARSQLPTTQLSRGWVSVCAVSIIDLETKTVYATPLLDQSVDGAGTPWGVAVDGSGRTLWIALPGVHELARLDLAGLRALLVENPELVDGLKYDLTSLYRSGLLQRVPLEANGPRGIALSPDETQIAVAAYFSGELLLTDPSGVVAFRIPLGAQPVADSIRRGESLFCNASNSYQRWVSCVTCHPGGRTDGMNWDLLNDGFGNPKNVKSMLHATHTEPAMWTGVRANAMVGIEAGFKYIEFQARPEQDYEDIYNYLASLEPEPSPHLADGWLTPDAVQGKAIFESDEARCIFCHRSDKLYSGTREFDVGTRHENDWTVEDIEGYIPPPLYELWRSAPYLHDGSAVTLRDMLTIYNQADEHGKTSHLTSNQINQLAAYLLQLGGRMPSFASSYSTLDVINGDGAGQYLPGSTVVVAAMDDPPGLAFSGWSGEPVQDSQQATTVIYMPDTDAMAIATFADLPGLPDHDFDGMPDSWVWSNFGHADAQAYDLSRAGDDADADGRSNYEEYIGGTDPRNSNDVFFVSIRGEQGGLVVGFDALQASGYGYTGLERMYELKATTNLVSGTWGAVPGMADVSGTDEFISVTNSAAEKQKFFRGEVLLQNVE